MDNNNEEEDDKKNNSNDDLNNDNMNNNKGGETPVENTVELSPDLSPEESPESPERLHPLECSETKLKTAHKDFQLTETGKHRLESVGYQIVCEIGFGFYGKVYRAISEQQKCEVAIKVMDIKRYSRIYFKKFLHREIKLMKELPKHENIISFYDIIDESETLGLVYAVMELAVNGDLLEFIIKRRYVPENQAIIWFKQLISGVQHIHSNGYAHRDLKCENLLLDANYIIKIADFGFCCKLDKLNPGDNNAVNLNRNDEEVCYRQSKTFCGSCVYASPEILNCEPYTPVSSDIWSCGVILYVMIYGSYPNANQAVTFREVTDTNGKIKFPELPQVCDDSKEVLNKIFVTENQRITMKQLLKCQLFNKEITVNDTGVSVTEYFETLGIIQRQETQPFDDNNQLNDDLRENSDSDSDNDNDNDNDNDGENNNNNNNRNNSSDNNNENDNE